MMPDGSVYAFLRGSRAVPPRRPRCCHFFDVCRFTLRVTPFLRDTRWRVSLRAFAYDGVALRHDARHYAFAIASRRGARPAFRRAGKDALS